MVKSHIDNKIFLLFIFKPCKNLWFYHFVLVVRPQKRLHFIVSIVEACKLRLHWADGKTTILHFAQDYLVSIGIVNCIYSMYVTSNSSKSRWGVYFKELHWIGSQKMYIWIGTLNCKILFNQRFSYYTLLLLRRQSNIAWQFALNYSIEQDILYIFIEFSLSNILQ